LPGPGDPSWSAICEALHGRRFVVLDTETTGLHRPEVVSIAVVASNGRVLLDERVRPGRPIEPGASRITGLTEADLVDRPEFPAIYRRLLAAVSGQRVVIYNAAYDLGVLENTCRRYGLLPPALDAWCAMEWYARLHGEWDAGRQSYRWQRLSTAAARFGVTAVAAHSALGDCRTTLAVVEAALDQAAQHISAPYQEGLFGP
jgi:DNA polymerase-3 subunit epsilon